MKCKNGRHGPAFILLFLSEKPYYGFEILKEFENKMPENRMDSALIYRTLKTLEDNGSVTFEWDTSESGAAKKIYSITDIGLKNLAQFKDDIVKSKSNLEFFLKKYDALNTEV